MQRLLNAAKWDADQVLLGSLDPQGMFLSLSPALSEEFSVSCKKQNRASNGLRFTLASVNAIAAKSVKNLIPIIRRGHGDNLAKSF
jgi:hypothetical protein